MKRQCAAYKQGDEYSKDQVGRLFNMTTNQSVTLRQTQTRRQKECAVTPTRLFVYDCEPKCVLFFS